MGARPTSSQASKTSRQARAASAKRYKCTQPPCDTRFTRHSDLKRHLRDRHGLGLGSIWHCSVPGCLAKHNRLDKFKAHIRRAHPLNDLDCIVRESAIPIDNVVRDNVSDDGRCYQSEHGTGTPHRPSTLCAGDSYAVDGCRMPMNRLKWTIGILELLRELHAKLDSNSDPELPTNANSVINTTEYGGCDDPCDANESNCHQSYGNYQGLLPPGSGGCGHGGGLGNGKQPVRDDGEPDANASKGGLKGDPEAIENALPCVFCFFGLRADLTRDCRTRKRYISLLWPHHYRHDFACCQTCFRTFNDRDAVERHRKGNDPNDRCVAMCLHQNCPNQYGAPTPDCPCTHNGHFSPVVIWQMLYRVAHRLAPGIWVPDPTLNGQVVGDNLPPHHPMFPWSRQILPQVGLPATTNNQNDPYNHGTDLFDQLGTGFTGAPDHGAAPGPAGPRSDHDLLGQVLRSVLAVLWGCVNRLFPSWDDHAQALWQVVPPLHPQTILSQRAETVSDTSLLQFLANQYAAVIDGRIPRDMDTWIRMQQLTRGLLPGLVEVPEECPWFLRAAAHPTLSPGPSRAPPVDPVLETLGQPSWLRLNGLPIASTTSRDLQPIPQAAIDATNQLWRIRTDQDSRHLSPQTPTDRRPSLGSLTSPSTGPFFSAPSSVNHTPWNRSTTSGSRHQQDVWQPDDDFAHLVDMNGMDENEQEQTELDDVD